MKKIILSIAAAAIILSVGLLPEKILSGAAHYTMIKPVQEEYQPQLTCSGFVMAQEGVQLVVSSNVVIKKLWVESGSWVSAGQLLAETEPPVAGKTFLSQSLDAPMAQLKPSELEALAAQYGVEMPASTANLLGGDTITAVATPAKEATAPISGVITWDSVREGRFLPAGSPFCTILGFDQYKAIVQIPADDAGLVEVGARATITGAEIGAQTFGGIVLSVGNSVNREVTAGGYNAVIEVELAIDAPAGTMRQGAGISCTIETGPKETLLTLPYETIRQDDQNHEYVYKAVNSVLKKQYIQTGVELDDSVQIAHGLTEDDLVATVDAKKPVKRYVLEVGPTKNSLPAGKEPSSYAE